MSVVCFVVITATCYIVFAIWDNFYRNFAPGPFRLPVFGSAFQMYLSIRRRPPFVAFKHFGAKYGPLVYLRAGQRHILLFNDFETAKAVMNNDIWFDRPQHEVLRERTFGLPIGLATGNGDGYREMRRFTVRTLREAEKVANIHKTLEEQVAALVERLNAVAAQRDPILQVKHLFTTPVLNVVWSIMSAARTPEEDQLLQRMALQMYELSKVVTMAGGVVDLWPWLRHVAPGLTGFTYFKKMTRGFLNNFLEFLAYRRQDPKRHEKRDWIDAFIGEMEKNGSCPNHYTKEQFASCMGDLLFPGSDTNNHTLEFAIDYVSSHPRIQSKIQKEIDEVLGPTRLPKVSDRHLMPYIEATITEVQRLSNNVPMTARCPTEDTLINGFYAKKGTFGVINIYSIHTNTEFWGDPFEFRPERFLEETQSGSYKLIPEKIQRVMAFGAGKRGCLGDHLSRKILFLFFVTLFQRFRFEQVVEAADELVEGKQLCEDEVESRMFSETGIRVGFTLAPHPFQVKVVRRN